MPTLRAKGPKDVMTRVLTKLQPPQGRGTKRPYEVTRSSQSPLLSGIKYILQTGIEPIDEYTGGFPFGRLVEVYGVEACGKTALCLRCCVRAQQHYIYQRIINPDTKDITYERVDEKCEVVLLYIDNEQSLDEGAKVIVDGTEIDALVARCDTIDQIFKMVDDTITTVETIREEDEAAARKKAKDSKEPYVEPLASFIVVVVDTIAGTSTQSDMDAEWGTQDYPRLPQQLKRAFSQMTRKINRNNVLFIATNQVGDTFKAKKKTFVNPYALDLPRPEDFKSPGGRAIKFFATLRIFMFPVNLAFKLSKHHANPDGFTAGFITVKNRTVKPYREGRFTLLYDGGLSNVFSVLETMLKCKVAARGEKGIIEFRFHAHGLKPTSFPGLKENENPELEDGNGAWPAFYQDHFDDMRLLWNRAIELTFNEANAVAADDDELQS
jgi:RecA/RadA recombinase